jgi:phenylpyruvate tautomerase PptA (4-oxalocrotonate tautomerase family)
MDASVPFLFIENIIESIFKHTIMPFVQINLAQSLSEQVKNDISKSIHESLISHFNIPADDYFQVIHELPERGLLFPASYMNIPHTGNLVYIQIIARTGRTVEMKKALYRSIAEKIAARTPISTNDVFIVLVENNSPDWSFGQGIAQYA